MANALANAGVNASLLPVAGADSIRDAARLISEAEIDHVVAFASFTADLQTLDGQSLYDALGCGLVGWDVDHPAYQFKRFATPIQKRVQICASQSHFRFARRMMGCQAVERLMLPAVDAVPDHSLPMEERPIPAMVAMSWLGEPDVWWSGTKGTPVYPLIEGVVGRLLADEEVDLFKAYEAAVADTGLPVAFDENISNLLANIALFVRRYDRMRLAQALAEMDFPWLICGSGWRDRLGERAHLTYGDDLDYANLDDLYGKCRVALNLNAANGGSERAISAMASGAAVVSDRSPLLQAEFETQDAIRFFDRRLPSTIEQVVASLLGSGEAQGVGARSRELVSQAHLWSHRATCLVETLQGLACEPHLQMDEVS
ncbi:MAG TPA: glycosyltransferase [Caulobacteraceae bacterium]|nr:glycosyltransferase [Caulobacteraceae bacterium]